VKLAVVWFSNIWVVYEVGMSFFRILKSKSKGFIYTLNKWLENPELLGELRSGGVLYSVVIYCVQLLLSVSAFSLWLQFLACFCCFCLVGWYFCRGCVYLFCSALLIYGSRSGSDPGVVESALASCIICGSGSDPGALEFA